MLMLPSMHGSTPEDGAAAHAHLTTVQDSPEVQALMVRCRAPGLLGSAVRFPGLINVVLVLLDADAATDANLALLFVDPRRVRGIVEQARMMQGAPASSPSGLMARAAAVPRLRKCDASACANDGPLKCATCGAVAYCSAACQRADWAAHKLACLDKQGRPLVGEARVRAEAAAAAKSAEMRLGSSGAAANAAIDDLAVAERNCATFAPFGSHTCTGAAARADLPAAYTLLVERSAQALGWGAYDTVNYVWQPRGVPAHCQRGVAMLTRSGALVLVMATRLFEDRGDGRCNGQRLDGVFVARGAGRPGAMLADVDHFAVPFECVPEVRRPDGAFDVEATLRSI